MKLLHKHHHHDSAKERAAKQFKWDLEHETSEKLHSNNDHFFDVEESTWMTSLRNGPNPAHLIWTAIGIGILVAVL